MTELADLRALAVDCGVELRFTDVFGARHAAPTDTIVAVLAALGVADRPADASEALRTRRAARAGRLLPSTVVAWDGHLRVTAASPRGEATIGGVVERADGTEVPLTLGADPRDGSVLTADSPAARGRPPGRAPGPRST